MAATLVAVLGLVVPAAALDFDGDGTDDLLFRDRRKGDHRITLMLGGTAEPVMRTITLSTSKLRPRGFEVRTGDFDGDGHTDILDRNLVSGITRVRLMDGTELRTAAAVPGLPDALGVELQEVADFDADGRDELLFRDGATGAWSLWFLQGTALDATRSGELPFARNTRLQLVAARDFTGDGRADLLLRDRVSLAWTLFPMYGRKSSGGVRVDALPTDPAWTLEAVEDMDRDGRADLLMRNGGTGAWQLWFLDGARVLSHSGPAGLADGTLWRLQALADVDGDGNRDALLLKPSTGEMRVELLTQRWRLRGSGPVALPGLAGVRAADALDIDGDSSHEVLFADPAEGWVLADLRNPAAPAVRPLGTPPPGDLPLACTPPRYHQYGKPLPPTDAGAQSAFLTWLSPVTRENGEALCRHELAGYRLVYQLAGSTSTKTIRVADSQQQSRLFRSLAPGTWLFRIVSIDTSGYVSQSSQALAKTVP